MDDFLVKKQHQNLLLDHILGEGGPQNFNLKIKIFNCVVVVVSCLSWFWYILVYIGEKGVVKRAERSVRLRFSFCCLLRWWDF